MSATADTVTTVALSDNTETGLVSKSGGVGETKSNYAGVDSGLSLFSPSLLEEGIEKEIVIDFHPLAALQKSKPVDFHIPHTNPMYIDLAKTSIRVKVKITTQDGSPIGKDDKVGFANNILHTLFQKMDLILNHKLVSPDVSIHYPYKQMMDILSYYPADFLQTLGSCQGFSKDTAYAVNSASINASGENKGFFERNQWLRDGESVTLEGGIGHDLALMNCFLPPGLDVKLRFWPSVDAFALVSDVLASENYLYSLEEMTLRVHAIQVCDDVIAKHDSLLSKRMATFHYQKSEFKSFTIPADQRQWQVNNLFNSKIPFETLIAFVDTSSYLGARATSPFNFQHLNIDYLGLYVSGYADLVFQPSFEEGRANWVHEYKSLYATDHGRKYIPGIISLADYGGGYSIFRFKLSSSQTIRTHRVQEGVGRLSIRFSKPLSESVTVLIYNRYHSTLFMDKCRNIWLTEV